MRGGVVRILLKEGLRGAHDDGGTALLQGLRHGFRLLRRGDHPDDEHAQEGDADAENQDQYDHERHSCFPSRGAVLPLLRGPFRGILL